MIPAIMRASSLLVHYSTGYEEARMLRPPSLNENQ